MPSGTLPIGHQYCKDKYRAQMNNNDDTPLSNDGDNTRNAFQTVAPGELHNRRQPTSSSVALCGRCVDQSYMLQASMAVGLLKVLGVCRLTRGHMLAQVPVMNSVAQTSCCNQCNQPQGWLRGRK